MEQINTILLGTISTLLGITLYVLSGLNEKIKDLKNDIGDRLNKIDYDLDKLWNHIRMNSNRITIVETILDIHPKNEKE